MDAGPRLRFFGRRGWNPWRERAALPDAWPSAMACLFQSQTIPLHQDTTPPQNKPLDHWTTTSPTSLSLLLSCNARRTFFLTTMPAPCQAALSTPPSSPPSPTLFTAAFSAPCPLVPEPSFDAPPLCGCASSAAARSILRYAQVVKVVIVAESETLMLSKT